MKGGVLPPGGRRSKLRPKNFPRIRPVAFQWTAPRKIRKPRFNLKKNKLQNIHMCVNLKLPYVIYEKVQRGRV